MTRPDSLSLDGRGLGLPQMEGKVLEGFHNKENNFPWIKILLK
jgi:hypothetical protein